jgi:hypothetical protein
MCAAPILALLLFSVEGYLLKTGMLGTKDLWPIGPESGAVADYVTNVWVWDGALLLVFIASAVMCLYGLRSIHGWRR